MRDGLGIALACNDLDWTRVWQGENCTVGRMVGVAAIGDAWLIEPPGGFWPKPGRSAVSGGNRVRVPAGRVITNKHSLAYLSIYYEMNLDWIFDQLKKKSYHNQQIRISGFIALDYMAA
jgi:hypothetical protein